MHVFLLATLDTKGNEIAFIRDRLDALGVETVVVDVGCLGAAATQADITRADVFSAAGTSLTEMQRQGDRGLAVSAAARGASTIISARFAEGNVAGVLAIGGSAGTSIGTAAMRALPLGVPKLMVSTLASGDVRAFVGDKDILMMNSVVDILGINRISKMVLSTAAHAMAGMVQHRLEMADNADRPLVAATMFGVTTPCVEAAREILTSAGYEVLVFHATGTGGQAMESLIREGLIAGVLDITTTELADELVGGVLSAGPDRLTAAAACGIPQVVSAGATDMVNFWAMDSVPPRFAGRQLHKHNDNVTLMRTTPAECAAIGALIGEKLADASETATIMLPLQGVSALDRTGQPFADPVAREALFAAIRQHSGNVTIVELDQHINDPEFATAAAKRLIEMMKLSCELSPGYWVCGIGSWVLGIGYRASGIGYRVSGIGYRVSGIGYRVSGIGYRVSGIGHRVSGIGYRVWVMGRLKVETVSF